MKRQFKNKGADCTRRILATLDAMDVLNGKWKVSILMSLYYGDMKFMELQQEVAGISGKMLSRELKLLETNQLVRRTVMNTQPVTVSYSLTPYGKTLETVINAMADWGLKHRKRIIGK
jgi:DNA-binding HxlR family transcriptional regulator